jgi:CBS domain-containing protein
MADIATPLAQIAVVGSSESVETALERMRNARASRALVVDRGALVGILTLKDLASHLRFKAEFSTPELRPAHHL